VKIQQPKTVQVSALFPHTRIITPVARCFVARSDAHSIEQFQVTVSSQEQPRAARPYPRDSELHEAPLSQASYAHGFSSESDSLCATLEAAGGVGELSLRR